MFGNALLFKERFVVRENIMEDHTKRCTATLIRR